MFGRHSKQMAYQNRLTDVADSLNFLKIASIIHVYGYPGPDIIGTEANQVLFGIIYTSTIDTAKKFIPIIWQALQKGDATADNYAALADRVAMTELHGQIYGTIVIRKGMGYELPPVLNKDNVDHIREKIGLPPLKQYLQQYGINWP